MKKILLILLAFLYYVEMQAQVPGYRGKKLMLGYSAQMAPNFHNWFGNGGTVPLRLHPKHIFSAEYITGRHTIIALEGGFMRYKRTLVEAEKPGDVQFNGSMVGFNVKMFGNNLAPVGNYMSLNAQQMFLNFIDENGWSEPVYNTDKEQITGKFMSTAVGIGFGTRRVYANSIVADMGLSFGYALTTFNDGNILLYQNSRTYVEDFMLYRHVLNYKLGISGLLF